MFTEASAWFVLLLQDHAVDNRGYAEVWTSPSDKTTRAALLGEVRLA
jgi:hypothetical protein